MPRVFNAKNAKGATMPDKLFAFFAIFALKRSELVARLMAGQETGNRDPSSPFAEWRRLSRQPHDDAPGDDEEDPDPFRARDRFPEQQAA